MGRKGDGADVHGGEGSRHARNGPANALIWCAVVLAGATLAAGGQASGDAQLQRHLGAAFPSATSFSPKQEDPPHFRAYEVDPRSGRKILAGFAFWTTDLEPLERGYSGPIRILVGMDTKGILRGILVVDHREPYADFSIDLPSYSAQFIGKDIRDSFRLGADIDGIARATVTVSSATRSVRNSARRVARQLLTP